MHTLAINYAHAALRLCLQCTQDSSTWDHAHTHLLRHISAQNALKTVPRQITYALAAWYFCSNCTQNSFTWDHAHTCTCCITSLLKMHSKQLHVRSQTHLLHDIFAQNALKTAPGEHGCTGFVASQQEGLDLVAQLRLQSIVPSHAWFLCVCWKEEGVLESFRSMRQLVLTFMAKLS